MSKEAFTRSVFAFLILIGLLPLVFMVGSTLFGEDGFSFAGYNKLLHTLSLWQSFAHSLLLAWCVALLTTLLGTLLGILLSKTTLLGRMVWLALLVVPLLVPPYIMAYGWYALLGRESALGHLLFGFWGTVWVLVSIYLPIAILIIALFIRQHNPRFEEAGHLLGSWMSVLRGITLPLLRPAMLLNFVLVFVLTMGESSVANFLRYDIFPMQSFVQFSAFYDFKTATIYTMPLLLVVGVALVLEYHAFGKRNLSFQSYPHPTMIPLNTWHIPLLVLVVSFITLTVLLPLWGLIQQSTWASFIQTIYVALPVLTRSIVYALMGATLLVFFGTASAYIVTYASPTMKHLLNVMLLFFFVLSSVVIGIALILFWNTPYTNWIYTTPLIILFGYLVKYLLLSTKIIALKFVQIPSTLLESAQLSGASWFQILYTVLVPLSKEALMMAWIVGFIFSLRESTITMLVAPAGSSTLPTYILTQMANGNASTIASLCLLMLLLTLLPLLGLWSYTKKGI